MLRDFIKKLMPEVEDDFLSEILPFSFPVHEYGFELSGYQLSVYSERWSTQLHRTKKHGIIVANNTYLSSFTYNVAAVWIHYCKEYNSLKDNQDCQLSKLLTYNFKKFFAEQIIYRSDCVFGSAIFLETLLYEEEIMIPIIKAAENSEEIKFFYHEIQKLMSSLLLFHEIGYIVRDARSDMLEIMKEDSGIKDLDCFWGFYTKIQRIEFECDAFAVLLITANSTEGLSLEKTLKAIYFAFAIFSVMISLDASAEITANETQSGSESIDLDNVFNRMEGANFSTIIDPFSVERARSVQFIVEKIAHSKNINLYSCEGDFLVFNDLIDVLTNFSQEIIDTKKPSYRGKCEMLARALKGNPRGMRYLRLRSKQFDMPKNRNK